MNTYIQYREFFHLGTELWIDSRDNSLWILTHNHVWLSEPEFVQILTTDWFPVNEREISYQMYVDQHKHL